mgnify:CR=1 FL=1
MRKETMKHKILNLLTNLKNEKGATGADIVVALSIIVLTVSVISMVYINLTNGSKNVNRTAGATRIATNILENIDKMSYEQYNKALDAFATNDSKGWTVTGDANAKTIILEGKKTGTEKIFDTKIPKGYKVELTSQSINAGDSLPKYDLIKKINVKVTFTVSKTEQNVSLYTSKEREQLAEVNKPDIDSLNVTGKSYVPIKYSTTQQAYVVTDEKDINWYDYSNKVWAMVYVDSLSNINSIKNAGKLSTAQANSTGNIYYWIPRFSTDGQALYNASNYPITNIQITAINDNTKKMSLFSVGTETLSADTNEFNSNGKKGLWKAKNLLNSDGTMQAFNRTKFGPVQY